MSNQYKQGMASALGCAVWWGIMPIYWQMLQPISSLVIIFYRILLVAVVCFIMALKVHGMAEIRRQFAVPGIKLR